MKLMYGKKNASVDLNSDAIHLLFDGWPVIYAPASPASLHLQSLFDYLPPQVQAWLAAPAPIQLGDQISACVVPTADTPSNRLLWEQKRLPEVAVELQVALIHHTNAVSALFGRVRQIASPCEVSSIQHEPVGWAERLRSSLAAGGRTLLSGVVWPEDLPVPDHTEQIYRLAGFVPPAFFVGGAVVDDPYVLYHGPTDRAALGRLIAGWSWASPGLGPDVPLQVVGYTPVDVARLYAEMPEEMRPTVHVDSPRTVEEIASLYRRAAVVYQPFNSPAWCSPLQLALACGRPVVTWDTPRNAILAGPAAFLVAPEDVRHQGAAILSVIVEEDLAARLSQAAQRQSSVWNGQSTMEDLLAIYRAAIGQPLESG